MRHEFARFASEEGFIRVTSSPRYPQSNGKAERTVQTVKAMLKKSVDPYRALLAYRTTSLEFGYSPAPTTDGSATEDVDPCDGVDATTSLG